MEGSDRAALAASRTRCTGRSDCEGQPRSKLIASSEDMSATSALSRVSGQKKSRTRLRILDGYIGENHGAIVPVPYLFIAPEPRADPAIGPMSEPRVWFSTGCGARTMADSQYCKVSKSQSAELVLVWCLHAWHDNYNATSLFYLWKAWPYITGYISSILKRILYTMFTIDCAVARLTAKACFTQDPRLTMPSPSSPAHIATKQGTGWRAGVMVKGAIGEGPFLERLRLCATTSAAAAGTSGCGPVRYIHGP